MEEVCVNLSPQSVVLRNLKAAMYKMTSHATPARVTAMTSHGNHVFVGVANHGCQVFKLSGSQIDPLTTLAVSPKVSKSKKLGEGASCHEICVSPTHVIYIKEEGECVSLCVHAMEDVLGGATKPTASLELARRAPMVLEPQLGLLVLGGMAWKVSWTSGSEDPSSVEDSDESHVRVLELASFSEVKQWQAVQHAVGHLRAQRTQEHSLLGVSDTRNGLKVYDLRQPIDDAYACLYQVPVDEIRNFRLVGNFVAVFHKFEPNVSFWNMKEQRTILCINIQDQMKQLAEEFLEDDDDDDAGLFGDDDDHVTSVTGVPSDNDNILIYGTKSGCIFGMSVLQRIKLFNIPCPHETETPSQRRDVQAVTFVAPGRLAVCYEKHGLTVLDFSPENPPDRPPTRCQKRQ